MIDFQTAFDFFEESSKNVKELKKIQKDKEKISDKTTESIAKKYIRSRATHNPYNHKLIKIEIRNNSKSSKEEKIAYEYLKKICDRLPEKLNGSNRGKFEYSPDVVKKYKDLLDLFNIDSTKYGLAINDYGDFIAVKTYEYGLKKNEIKNHSMYRLFHVTEKAGLTCLKPSLGSRFFRGTYAKPSVFFWLVKKDSNQHMSAVLRYMLRNFGYGSKIYEYIPRKDDVIYRDNTDIGYGGSVESLLTFGCIPVFIETDKPLPVKHITGVSLSGGELRKRDEKEISEKHHFVNWEMDKAIRQVARHYALKCVEEVFMVYSDDNKKCEKELRKVIDEYKQKKKSLFQDYKNQEFKNVYSIRMDNYLKDEIKTSQFSWSGDNFSNNKWRMFEKMINEYFNEDTDGIYYQEMEGIQMNEEMIFQRIEKILERMGQKEQLQSLAKEKGLPINELELTNDTKDAVVLSVIALMLAKQEGDPRYRKLSDFGMQKRSLKVELINDYKQRANMLLNKYRSHGTPDQVSYVDTPIDESYSDQSQDDDEFVEEAFGLTKSKNVYNRMIEQFDIIVPFIEPLYQDIKDDKIKTPNQLKDIYRRKINTSYGYTSGSTTYGDGYYGNTFNVSYGDPTLETYLPRAIQVFNIAATKKRTKDAFTDQERSELLQFKTKLENLKKSLETACRSNERLFHEYKPKEFKQTLSNIETTCSQIIEKSKELYDYYIEKT